MKMIFKTLLTIIIISIIILTFFIYIFQKEDTSYEIKYSFFLNPLDEFEEYQIYCPIPVNIDGRISRINDYLMIKSGDIIFSIENTIHGFALNVSGKGICNIELNIKNNKDFNFNNNFPILSMDKDYETTGQYDPSTLNAEYYTFLKTKLNHTVELSIDFIIDYEKLENRIWNEYNQEQYLNGTFTNGWNIINGKKLSSST